MHATIRSLLGAAVAALPAALPAQLPTIALRPGLVITHSVRIRPGTYRLAAPSSLDSALVTVRGDDVTVDFAGARLVGLAEDADPDAAAGVAVRVDGGHNVRIVNARIRGYKIAILARGTRGLVLADDDLSYNWKPRLYSLVEHESLVDWLSFHHQEKDEWLRYGAAAYLEDVSGGEIHDVRAEQGMNGLLLTRCDHLRVWNNVFSFDSGLGIGLYRSSDNTIMHNHVDYDVRGYSHGFYRRGQDSAALLIYEQSMRNIVAFNSMTHGGDGLFLWAGQQTMDTGLGGANDNLFYANDFSFAPTNGMEATFSRNRFVANRIEGSDHGLWGGYSWSSLVVGNDFVRNRIGIAIEHGQDDSIQANVFDGDTTAIYLWANPGEPADWGYPKHHDTHSRDYLVTGNLFRGNRVAIRAANTARLSVRDDRFAGVDTVAVLKDTSAYAFAGNTVDARAHRGPAVGPASVPAALLRSMPRPLRGGLSRGYALARLPRSAIVVDDWGPFDYRSPKLWPLDSTHAVPLRLRVLGPRGRWRVVERRGVAALSHSSGRLPDSIAVTPRPDSAGDWEITLEYRGGATLSPRGVRRPAGAPYRFSYGQFQPRIGWHVRFFTWADSTDPRSKPQAFDSLLARTPLLERDTPRLDYEWYGPQIKALPLEKWALAATGSVELPAGSYTLRTISDDAVRVWVDGRLVIDDWKPHESAVDTASMSGGRHDLRVEYYQVDGWTELRLDVDRR